MYNLSLCKRFKTLMFEGPGTDPKKSCSHPNCSYPSETTPTKMRGSILSIPPHAFNSHCSVLTSPRALVLSPGQCSPAQLPGERTRVLPPEICAVGASWAGSWMSPRAPGRDLAASWQQLPTGSLELLAKKLQPNRMLLTPMQYLVFSLEPQLLASEEGALQ